MLNDNNEIMSPKNKSHTNMYQNGKWLWTIVNLNFLTSTQGQWSKNGHLRL